VEIVTERLRLRELTLADRPALAAILQDPETMVAYEGPFSDAEVDTWLTKTLRRYAEDGFGHWAVELSPDDSVIGQCGLTMQNIEGELLPEVGYLFNRQFWHHGYATEAARASLTYGFANAGLARIYCQVRDTNTASQAVASRLGMKEVRRFTKQYRGATIPHILYAIDQADWMASAAGVLAPTSSFA